MILFFETNLFKIKNLIIKDENKKQTKILKIEKTKLKKSSSSVKGLWSKEYKYKKPIKAIKTAVKKLEWFSGLNFFFIFFSSEKIVAVIPIIIKIDIIRYTFFYTFWLYISVPKKAANHKLPAPATNIAIL